MTYHQRQPQPATITWRHAAEHAKRTSRVDLGYGRSRGLDDVTTARRILAISALGDLQLVDAVVVLDVKADA